MSNKRGGIYLRLIGILIWVPAIMWCQIAKSHFKIMVSVKDMPAHTIVLQQLSANDRITVVDSAHVDNDGHFTLSGTSSEAELYRLRFAPDQFIYLSLDSGEVTVSADWNDLKDYSVSGSEPSADLQKFVLATGGFMTNLNTMNVVFDSLIERGNDSLLALAKKDARNMAIDFTKRVKQYADTNPYEPNAVFAAKIISTRTEMDYLLAFNKKLTRRFPHTQMTNDFGEYMNKVKVKK